VSEPCKTEKGFDQMYEAFAGSNLHAHAGVTIACIPPVVPYARFNDGGFALTQNALLPIALHGKLTLKHGESLHQRGMAVLPHHSRSHQSSQLGSSATRFVVPRALQNCDTFSSNRVLPHLSNLYWSAIRGSLRVGVGHAGGVSHSRHAVGKQRRSQLTMRPGGTARCRYARQQNHDVLWNWHVLLDTITTLVSCALAPFARQFECMTALIRYDAARRALAAAHRVDEVKAIRDKAEAVRVYAKQAGDFDLQNQAAEIRIRAERRAGQLLLDMEKNPGRRGEGRPRKDGTKFTRSSGSTAYPPKLEDIGVSKDQSSKWQRLALLVDEATFERALVQAREKTGELTNAALLREIRETITPNDVPSEPDINVVAAELTRDIESQSRREKLEAVVRLRSRLNPTITKRLTSALRNLAKHAADCEKQISTDFEDYPANGKAFQRVIRERMAEQPDPLLAEKLALAADFKNATVREISLAEARNVLMGHEYLGTLGSAEFSYGLFFGKYLAGAVAFGSTAGTAVKRSVVGEHADKVISLTRGCCLPWADPPRKSSDGRVHAGSAASFLISAACHDMTKKGYNVFIGYADPQAGERGVIFRACNFLYCGTTSPTEKFRRPDGKVFDARNVHLLTRDRRFGRLRYKRTRAEQKQILIEQGCEFFKGTECKHRFVGIFGDRRTKKILRRALRWDVMEYPKPQPSSQDRVPVVDVDPVPTTFAAASVS